MDYVRLIKYNGRDRYMRFRLFYAQIRKYIVKRSSLFIILLVLTSLLSGCGRKAEAPAVAPTAPAEAAVETAEEHSAAVEEPAENAGDAEEPRSAEEIAAFIVEYYTEKFVPEGEYVIFDSETEESEDSIRFIVRYRPSEKEEEDRIASGAGPIANVYVVTVTYDKATNTLFDENGLDLNAG